MSLSGYSGAVLAGGESRRMGRDKAELIFHGEPLWRRQARVLAASGAQPVSVVRRPGQTRLSPAVPQLVDSVEGVGPLAGLHAALAASPGGWVGVLAADMPGITASWFETLLARCAPGVGAVMQHDDGFEPLAAIYPTEALETVTSQLQFGRFSLQDLIGVLVTENRMHVETPSENFQGAATNCNTPAEFARALGAGQVSDVIHLRQTLR